MSKYANDIDMMGQALLAQMQRERDDAIKASMQDMATVEQLRAELAAVKAERDLHYGRVAALIYSEAMKDVFTRDVQKWHSEYVDAQKELTTLRAEIAACQKDAERYRWLDAQNRTLSNDTFLVLGHDVECEHCESAWVGADLRAAIDGAMEDGDGRERRGADKTGEVG